jgi:lipopolysaccharide/colanic/teichoic acid biosynthesis glycosyltransferase
MREQQNELAAAAYSMSRGGRAVCDAPAVEDLNRESLIAVEPRRHWRDVQSRISELYPVEQNVSLAQRAVEILIASTALLLFAPMLLVVALIVRLDSPGPCLFRQNRLLSGGRLFRFAKFRTLYVDARERFPELYAYQYSDDEIVNLCFKVPNDPRVTRMGRWLRSSTLDELPNFWHVLTGEMALVGPRPEIPEMLPYYSDRALKKFTVRPGITGLAQSSGRGNLSFADTISLDLEYVENRSFWMDLKIILQTMAAIIRRDGAF